MSETSVPSGGDPRPRTATRPPDAPRLDRPPRVAPELTVETGPARAAVPGKPAPPPRGEAAPSVRGERAQPPMPGVSVVMPVLNEARHLRDAVTHVLAQDYPGELELIMALGPSRDETDAIAAELAWADPRVRAVPNPSGSTPAGLNAAVAAARYPVVARVDAHGLLAPGYLRTAVQLLERTGAQNVGGVMAAEGRTAFERAVAAAMRSALGVGPARFHIGGEEGPADTVYLGVFRRQRLRELGGYDESLSRAQDWELNFRIRRSGGLVWFTPQLHVVYRPRSNLRALTRQYFDYGRWRRGVIRRHPDSITLRYLAPPTALLAVAGGSALAATGRRWALLAPGGYLAGLLAGSAWVGRALDPAARLWLPGVIATMHGAWGAGFLVSDRTIAAVPAPASPPGGEPEDASTPAD